MTDREKIIKLVQDYQEAIHSQDKDFFYELWTQEDNNSLISITNQFNGIDSIYNDFLIGAIQSKYLSINLITESIEIEFITDDIAKVIFQYHTECIQRIDNQEYGIEGLETQIVQKIQDKWKLVHIHYSK